MFTRRPHAPNPAIGSRAHRADSPLDGSCSRPPTPEGWGHPPTTAHASAPHKRERITAGRTRRHLLHLDGTGFPGRAACAWAPALSARRTHAGARGISTSACRISRVPPMHRACLLRTDRGLHLDLSGGWQHFLPKITLCGPSTYFAHALIMPTPEHNDKSSTYKGLSAAWQEPHILMPLHAVFATDE